MTGVLSRTENSGSEETFEGRKEEETQSSVCNEGNSSEEKNSS